MKKYLIFIAVVVIAVLAFEFLPVKRFGGGYGLSDSVIVTDSYNLTPLITVGIYTSSSYSLIARNQNRQYLEICNMSNSMVYLYATSVSTTVLPGNGFVLNASNTAPYRNCKVWKAGDELYLGQVMTTSTATTTYKIIEY